MTDTLAAPKPRTKGPIVWMDMDQTALDNAYDQAVYAPNQPLVHARHASPLPQANLKRSRTRAGP
jgi:arylformamidase